MLEWISRINLVVAFVVLMVFHLLLYYSQNTDNWLSMALLASIVDLGVLAAIQLVIVGRRRERNRYRG